MARSDNWTALPLDTYCQHMAINHAAFNQVTYPNWPVGGECPDIWYQRGDPMTQEGVGRDELAIAVGMAGDMISNALGFFVVPVWTVDEEHEWVYPKQGDQLTYPLFITNWGYVASGGIRAMTSILDNAAIVYSDPDGDGFNELATITITNAQMVTAGASVREVRVYFNGYTTDDWEIRTLTIVRNAVTGNVTITGPTWMFTDPTLWNAANPDPVNIAIAANFVAAVDVWRVWNDTSTQANIVWKGTQNCLTAPCLEICQTACIVVDRARQGIVIPNPASYSATTGAWSTACLTYNYPTSVRLSYLHGLPLVYADITRGDGKMTDRLAEAIVRLANTLLPEAPCGCGLTRSRWVRDRVELDINSPIVATAYEWFGTTMAGAIFAAGVVRSLNPLGRSGSL